MKHVNEFVDGDHGTYVLLISQLNKGVTAKGSPYLSLTLQDKTGVIEGKLWSARPDQLANYKPGMILEFEGEVLSHNKQLQMRVNECRILDRSKFDIRDFVREGDISRSELKRQISEVIDSIKNPVLHVLINKVMEHFEKDFYAYPAAAKNHHDFVGGLATHVLGMLKVAEALCAIYPMLDRDLLVSGVIVHDIGKCIELSGPVITEYTMPGKLLGHISIMQAIVDETAKENKIEGEEVILLRHMILSHHGEYEFGSPVLPMIPEAEILHYIDNIDARMNSLSKALDGIAEGEFTPRIFALENRSFYKAKKTKE